MTGKELFGQALAEASNIIDVIQPGDFANQSPATEWNVHTLAEHMLYELSWVPDMVQGKTIAEVGDTYDVPLQDELLAIRWRTAADAARQAIAQVNDDDIVHTSTGDTTVNDYLQQVGFELLIHTWDLGKGVTTEVRFTSEAAQAAYDYAEQHIKEWQATGLFAASLVIAKDADAQARLLALTGRQA